MIYLIRLPYFDVDGKNPGTVLKFGFSDNYLKRMGQYKGYHINIVELKQYEGGTLEDESRLKIYFKNKGLLVSGNEWIKDCKESLDVFNNSSNIEDLRRFLDKQSIIKQVIWIKKVQVVDKAIIRLLCDKGYDEDKLKGEIEILKHYNNKDQIKILQIHLGISGIDILGYIKKFYNKLGSLEEVQKFMEEFTNITVGVDRMKFLVEFYNKHIDHNKELVKEVLSLIPSKYSDYLTQLGPDLIKGYGYQESRLKSYMKSKCANNNAKTQVDEMISSTFEVGRKYDSDYIRDVLSRIYNETGYTKSPKTSHLNPFYETKSIKIKNKDGNWIHGLEIIAKK